MNPKIKLKVNLIVDVCANSSAASIRNGLGEVSYNDIKATLVGFDYDLSILNEDYVTYIEPPNGYVIYHINDTSLIHRDAKSMLSTTQGHDIGISAHDIAKHYSRR